MLIRKKLVFVFILFSIISVSCFADSAFDFGLPIFGKEEVRFEQSKEAGFNIQLLKKYLLENENKPLNKLDAISKWVVLIKLSDTSRKPALEKFSMKYFSCKNVKKIPSDRLILNIFAQGLLLSQIKEFEGENNKEDERFESLLLEAEDIVGNKANYLIVKGILFHLLRNRPNRYFAHMKPEEDLKRALSVLPKTTHYYFVMGQAFRFLGKKESSLFLSIASYEKSSSLGKRNGKLQNTILGIYMGLHEEYQGSEKPEPFWLEEAVYKKILFLSPNNPYALNNLGYLYAEFGINKKLALQLCKKATELSPENAGFQDSYGWAAFKNGDYKTAEKAFKKSLELREGIYEPYYHLATLYYVSERLELAADNYIKALQIRPDSAEALNNLAYLFAESGKNIDDALKMSLKAVKISSTNASYLDTLGWIYFQKKDYVNADKYLKKAAQLAPGEAEILMHIGKVYLATGEFTAAIDYLKEAKKNNAPSEEMEEALYLAFCLRDRLSSLAEFHKAFGSSVSKDKMCNLLSSLAQLYQEVGQYQKSIFYTKLCAGIKSGDIGLEKELFPFYELENENGKTNVADSKVPSPLVSENKSENNNQNENKNEGEKKSEDFNFDEEILVEKFSPLSISFGPDFFQRMSYYIPFFEQFSSKCISIFIGDIFYPANSFVLRISGETSIGKELQKLSELYFLQINGIKDKLNSEDALIAYRFGPYKLFMKTTETSVYYTFKKSFDGFDLDFLEEVFKYKEDGFIEVILSWKNFIKDIPYMFSSLIYNPFDPFVFIYSKYSMKGNALKEFSALVMEEKVSDDFMKAFTGKLLAFKVKSKQLGLSTTIQTKKENKTIYVSTYYSDFLEYIENTFSTYILPVKIFLEPKVNKAICFAARLFYQKEETKCPDGGEVSINPHTGIISCSKHKHELVLPFFLTSHDFCSFSRLRLEKLIKLLKLKPNEKKSMEKLVNKLIQDYNVPLCPDTGKFYLDADGNVSCTKHRD